jgi:hypothetical protein
MGLMEKLVKSLAQNQTAISSLSRFCADWPTEKLTHFGFLRRVDEADQPGIDGEPRRARA